MDRYSHTPLEAGNDGLTGRTVNNLAKSGVDTYGALMGLTPQQKLNLEGIGQQGRRQIDHIQAKVTVIFKPGAEPEPPHIQPTGLTRKALEEVATQLDDTDVPPDARHPAAPLVFTEADRNPEAATLVEVGPKYAHMSLGERIEQVRIARGYIQRVDTPQGTPFKKAVRYQDLMRLMRPLCVDWGIRWKPVHSELIVNERVEKNEKIWFRTLIKVVVRFKRTEDLDFRPQMDCVPDYEDLEFIVEGVDNQDKAMSKAYTLADKLAIIRMFNLEYGDDADHTPLNLAPDVPKANQECIDQIYVLLHADPEIEDPEAHLKAVAAEIGRKISRRVLNEYALPLKSLEQIRDKLQDASMDRQGSPPVEMSAGEQLYEENKARLAAERAKPVETPPVAIDAFAANITPEEQAQIDAMRGAGAELASGCGGPPGGAMDDDDHDEKDPIVSELVPTGSEHIEIPEKDQAKAQAAIAKMDARRAAETSESTPAATKPSGNVDPPAELGAGEQDFLNLGDQPEFIHPSQQMGSQANPF